MATSHLLYSKKQITHINCAYIFGESVKCFYKFKFSSAEHFNKIHTINKIGLTICVKLFETVFECTIMNIFMYQIGIYDLN